MIGKRRTKDDSNSQGTMRLGFGLGLSQYSWPAGELQRGEELDDGMFDFMNLTKEDTGVEGTIFISTAIGPHDPRVKWYPERPTRKGPCLIVPIGAAVRAEAYGLSDLEANRGEKAVRAWLDLNEQAVLEFWNDGVLWTRDVVAAFPGRLKKIS